MIKSKVQNKSKFLFLSLFILYSACDEKGLNNSSDRDDPNSEITAPFGLTATALSDTIIKLAWQHNCAFESGYRIYRSENNNAFEKIGSANELTYTDNTVKWNNNYHYKLNAFSFKASSDYATTSQPINISHDVAPSGLQIHLLFSCIKITWDDNCTFESGFCIERDIGAGWQMLTNVDLDTKEFTDRGLDHTKTYSYRVCAFVNFRQSAWTSTVTGNPKQQLFEMILVQGGTFTMGDTWNSGLGIGELPTHSVNLNSFYISKYEVTQSQWRTVMGGDPGFYFKGDQLPAESISWFEAVEFCNILSQLEGLTPCYSISGTSVTCDWAADGYRLPTEAEWEYAARGGPNDSNSGRFAGSDTLNDVAWYLGNHPKPHNVGTKKANELGLYDMSGNVEEWCWDWYDVNFYLSSPVDNPKGADTGSKRVARGGNWDSYWCYVRISNRSGFSPSAFGFNVGFRLVKTF